LGEGRVDETSSPWEVLSRSELGAVVGRNTRVGLLSRRHAGQRREEDEKQKETDAQKTAEMKLEDGGDGGEREPTMFC
jgi:hypothetical protein